MRIALIGYGKMGKMVEQIACERGHSIVAKWDSQLKNETLLEQADIYIDFTSPDQALHTIQMAANHKKNLVMGTTGWHDKLDEARRIVDESGIGFMHASNFSIGVALFMNLLAYAGTKMNAFYEYDVSGIEIHHEKKLDSPSGTAKNIIDLLEEKMPNRTKRIGFTSQRVGAVPGTHSILFNSPTDSLTLTHTAHNRTGFASGAVTAAEWLIHKKGFFDFNDLLRGSQYAL